MSNLSRCTCGKPTPESRYLCDDCADDVGRTLEELPALCEELLITLAKQARFTLDNDGARSTAIALPFDIAASAALHALRNELVGLVRLCIDHDVASTNYRVEKHPEDDVASMSAWLLWRVQGIAAQPWAVDALALVRLAARSQLIIDRPPERTYAGPCDICGRDLYAVHGRVTVTCHRCRRAYDLAERREWLLRVVDDRLATATEIARALTSLDMPVTAERIWQWKRRERIEARAHDKLDRPLYRVGDVVDLLIEHAERGA